MSDHEVIRSLEIAEQELSMLDGRLLAKDTETHVLRARVRLNQTLRQLTETDLNDLVVEMGKELSSANMELEAAEEEIHQLRGDLGAFQTKSLPEPVMPSDYHVTDTLERITEGGWEVKSSREHFLDTLYNLGDEVIDTITGCTGHITGRVIDHGMLPRYEVTVQNDLYGEYELYVQECDLCPIEDDGLDDWDLDYPPGCLP